MRTCPAAGLGISRSTSSKSPPGLEIWAAFIGVTSGAAATLIVAITPPKTFYVLARCWHCHERDPSMRTEGPRARNQMLEVNYGAPPSRACLPGVPKAQSFYGQSV